MKKKADAKRGNNLRPEYNLSQLKGMVRGKYARRFRAGTNLAVLSPEVARAFPSDKAVNEALRMLMKVAKTSLQH